MRRNKSLSLTRKESNEGTMMKMLWKEKEDGKKKAKQNSEMRSRGFEELD
jgi:hypothetical protein